MTTTPCQLKSMYDQGSNISAILREEKGFSHNTEEIIEIAYDLQTGSYIAAMQDPKKAELKKNLSTEIAKNILSLCDPSSILEAGVGEATTFSEVLKHLKPNVKGFGFDLSWSRVAYAKNWLKSQGFSNTTLCTGTLLHLPFSDNSIDVVYTCHSIEPNGGKEKPILKELFRVARKFIILFEPSYELANDEQKKRMDSHGYCKNLKGIIDSLGYDVLNHQAALFNLNPLNPAAITIIKKKEIAASPAHILACPKYKTILEEIGDMLFSPEALVVYPIVGGIPCLRIENGIFASKYKEVMPNKFSSTLNILDN